MNLILEKNKVFRAQPLFASHPVKLTALAYIKEALHKERYEEIREMISIAKEFGASEWDIRIAFIPGFATQKEVL